MLEWCWMTWRNSSESFWSKKGEVPCVRSVILYKTIFKRWNDIKVFFWALKLKTLQPFSRFIPHSYALRQNDFDMRLEVLTKVLVWNFPHVRVKSIVWSAARYEPWDRSWMDYHINFSHTDAAYYCREIFSVISFVWAQSDENDSFLFVLEIHRGFNKGSDGPPVWDFFITQCLF